MSSLRALFAAAAVAVAVMATAAPAEARLCQRAGDAQAVATIDVWGSTSCATGLEVARIAYAADWPDRIRVRALGRRVVLRADVLKATRRDFAVIYYGRAGGRTVNVLISARLR